MKQISFYKVLFFQTYQELIMLHTKLMIDQKMLP